MKTAYTRVPKIRWCVVRGKDEMERNPVLVRRLDGAGPWRFFGFYYVVAAGMTRSYLFLWCAELLKRPPEFFSAGLADDSNIYEWDVCITGPPDTL